MNVHIRDGNQHYHYHATKEQVTHIVSILTGRKMHSLSDIQRIVEQVSGVKIFQRTRRTSILEPRHVFYYLSKKYTNHSLAEIGKYAGGYDHSTILNALARVRDMLDTNDESTTNLINLSEDILRVNYTE